MIGDRRRIGNQPVRHHQRGEREKAVQTLQAAIAVTPGFEAPTVTPLHGSDWHAVRVMVPRSEMNHIMDDLYAVGARAILTTELLAVRV